MLPGTWCASVYRFMLAPKVRGLRFRVGVWLLCLVVVGPYVDSSYRCQLAPDATSVQFSQKAGVLFYTSLRFWGLNRHEWFSMEFTRTL